MKRIDTSGFSCPEPVIMTKKARFGEATGYKVDVKEEGSKWTLVLAR